MDILTDRFIITHQLIIEKILERSTIDILERIARTVGQNVSLKEDDNLYS
jgi:hypothetical protein